MNCILRQLLERNKLVNSDCYWFYPPYSMTKWIVVTYVDAIRFISGFGITKDNNIDDYGISSPFKLTEYKYIDSEVKRLIKEFKKLSLVVKENKIQEKLKDLEKDFQDENLETTQKEWDKVTDSISKVLKEYKNYLVKTKIDELKKDFI